MTRYDAYLTLHVIAAIIWLGAGFTMFLLSIRALRSPDPAEGGRLAAMNDWLAPRLFIPSSLAVFVLGLLMVVDGPWSFETLWIAIGLAGLLGGFAFGIVVVSPVVKRIIAEIEGAGGAFTARAAAETRRMLVLQRFDTLVLFVIVAAMVMKPTGDDTGVLAAMVAVFVAGLIYMGLRLRAMQGPPTAEPASA